MAGAQWKYDSTLRDDLRDNGHRYGFFAAVKALHRLKAGSVPVGELGPVRDECVRFQHSTALHFHAGDIESIAFDETGRATLTATFLGLFGAASPLAAHFSEEVIRAEEDDRPTLRAFYDLFHHRMLSLYFRAWKKFRMESQFRLESEDQGTKRMLCMAGVDGHGARAESGLSRLEVLELAPLLAMRARPPRVLALALERLLPGVSVSIEQFVQRRAALDVDDRMQLGRSSNRLGTNLTLGARVVDRSARFRVIMGPVTYDECERLMPGGDQYSVLRRVIEQFTRGTLECEVDVLLKENETPGYKLGATRGALLGVNTRLGGTTGRRLGRMRVLLTERVEEARAVLVDENAA